MVACWSSKPEERVRISPPAPAIYCPGQGLGDNWYAINKLLRLHNGEIKLSFYSRPEPSRSVNCYGRLKEILSVLDAPCKRIKITKEKPTNYKDNFFTLPWSLSYFNTKETYKYNKNNLICYQFDGQFQKQRGGLPSEKLLRKLFCSLQDRYVFVYLGRPLPLKTVVHYLATCRCFLGTCSGISHVAHSVGTPTCLIQGDVDFKAYHENKKYLLASSLKKIFTFVEGEYEQYC